jgi:CDP-2,3-bis-(O-geranylgeranyl)-sn-glycerol synthase
MPDLIYKDILLAIWFFLPAGLANVAPVLAMKIPLTNRLAYPLDFGKSIGGKRIFGDHKTFRGLIFGIITAIVVVWLQIFAFNNYGFINNNINIDYTRINPLILGGLLGFGSLAGDALKSFFKRRTNIKPGSSWFPFDQIDYIIGGVLFSLAYIQLSAWVYFWILLIWFLLHPISTFVGYLFKLKDSPI